MTSRWIIAVGLLATGLSAAETRVGLGLTGLDRIDQRSATKNNRFSSVRPGARSTIWILDDECLVSHTEFGGRATNEIALPGQGGRQSTHATQMASIAAGATVGVASRATIRCIDMVGIGWGPPQMTAAVNYILATPRTGREVVNISLEHPGNATIDADVQRLIDAGITVVASAGNSGQLAANVSPARLTGVITVGNLNNAVVGVDGWVLNSNHGAAVDILAPGVSINGADSDGGIAQYSDGTSQSAAYVSGVAATYLDAFPGATPAQVHSAIVGAATLASISGLPPNTTNRVLFSDFITPAELEDPAPPLPVSQRLGATPAGPLNSPPIYFGDKEDSTRTLSLRDIGGSRSHYVGGLKQGSTAYYSCPPFNISKFLNHQRGFLSRLEANGSLAWHIAILPGDSYCGTPVGLAEVVAVQIDTKSADRDVFAAIKFTNAVSLGPPETRLRKYSGVNGGLLWDVSVGTELDVVSITAPQVVGNGVYVIGTMTGINTGYTSLGGSDGFFAHVDRSSGAITPKGRFGTSGNDIVRAGAISGENSVIVTGSTTGNYGAPNVGGKDAFLAKVDTLKAPIIYQYGTSADDEGVSLARGPGPSGNRHIVVGNTNGALEPLFPGHPGGAQDGFIWVIDEVTVGSTTTLSKVWGRRLGSTNTDTLWAVRNFELSNHNTFFVGGSTYGSIAGNNPSGRDSIFGKFVAEPGQTPELRWMWQSATAGEDEILDLDVGDSSTQANLGHVHLIGSTTGGFPPNTTSPGGSDGFRVRLTGF